MSGFIQKKLAPEDSPGEKLRQKRQTKNLKIEEVSRATKIRPEYLVALEEERWDLLPSGLYGKNFLKRYAIFLDLNPDEFIKNFSNQYKDYNEPDDPFSQKVVKPHKFLVFPKIARNIIIAFLIFICFLYLIFYFRNIVSTPPLTIIQPNQNLLTTSTSITIIGRTDPQASISLNQENIINDDKGYFSKKVNLKKGLNVLTVQAQKKHSRARTVSLKILVQ